MSIVPKYVPQGPDFERKAGDTDAFRDILQDENAPFGAGSSFGPLDLTGASSVAFHCFSISAAGLPVALFNGAATVEDAAQGIVSYTPTSPQVTALTGPNTYLAHWVVTDASGIRRIPRGTAYRVIQVGVG